MTVILWRRARDFVPALPAPIASLCSLPRRQKQSTGLFLSANFVCSLLVRIPCLNIKQKRKRAACCDSFLFGGEQGIRTLEQVIACYAISNRAPSASSDNSPYLPYSHTIITNNNLKIKCIFKFNSYGYLHFCQMKSHKNKEKGNRSD